MLKNKWSVNIKGKKSFKVFLTGKESIVFILSENIKNSLLKRIGAYIIKNRKAFLKGQNQFFKPKLGLETVKFEKI